MKIRPRARAMALTKRIVAGYTLAAALILTVSALFLYDGLKEGFVVEDTELLSDQIEQVRDLISKSADADAHRFILAAAGVRDLEKYYGRLLDEHGTVVVETPGMDHVGPPAAGFPNPIHADKELHRVAFWHGEQGRFALLGSGKVARPNGAPSWVFQIALDAGHVEEWLSEYRARLYWMVGGGTFLTALLGCFITRRGLRPLRDITDKIKEVTAQEMHDRLDARQWPSELAVLAEEFDDMLGRLRDSFDRLSQFSADVSHEFRTPLNNLMGATSLVLSRSRSADDYRTALEANIEQFERLNRMVASLLFIARADNAEAVLNVRRCDVGGIMREVCDFFSALADEQGIALESEGTASTQADEVLLRLALTNLVSNALRHTPRGGRVQTRVQTGPAGCEIEVADTGTGIAPEHHSRLFDRFYRVDEARSGADSGSGLGLAIVKSVVTLHKGTIAVESTPGKGTTVRLHLP